MYASLNYIFLILKRVKKIWCSLREDKNCPTKNKIKENFSI